MTRVLVLDEIHEDGLSLLRGRDDIELRYLPDPRPDDIAAEMRTAEALLLRGRHLDPACWNAAPALRFVSRHGVGCDNLPLPDLAARGVTAAITARANATSVAEHALMLMLAAARGLVASDAAVRSGNFARREEGRSVELGGRRLLILGLGRIGREVAARAAAFGMRVSGYDPYLPADEPLPNIEREGDLDAALATTQVVSLHLPRTDATLGFFDAARFAQLPRGAMLVNTSRGGVVDEAALAEALRSGHLAAAATDVFEHEPVHSDAPILAAPNLTVTPHDAAMTREGAQRMAVSSARNILDFIDGKLDPAMRVGAPGKET